MEPPPDRPAEDAAAPVPPPPPEPRQRWRVVFRRAATDPARSPREAAEAWQAGLRASGLPVVTTDAAGERPRLAFGAPLPGGASGEAELAELWLTDRRAAWQVREALVGCLPASDVVVAVEDVWLGAPALAGRVAAADYRIALAGSPDPEAVRRGAAILEAAGTLPREREKGGSVKRYDLRPLLLAVRLAEPGPPPVVVARTRIHPELGSGRPEEVVAALGDTIGLELEVASVVRERLLLLDEL